MADDKIIQFPTNRIVNDRTRELNAQRKKMGEKVAKQIQQQQTKQFVETAVDDISMTLLKAFVDLAMKTNQPNFTKDLALLVDVMRGMIYRDFAVDHPAQKLADKMVQIRYKNQRPVATVNYGTVIDDKRKRTPIKGEFKEELDDTRDGFGEFIDFDPDFDLS